LPLTLFSGKIMDNKIIFGTTTKHRGRCADPGGWAVAREAAGGSPQGETSRDGANQQQPKVGPQGESRLWDKSRKTAVRQLRRRSGLGKPANQMNGSERVKCTNFHEKPVWEARRLAGRLQFYKFTRKRVLPSKGG
jgi:hypothetical protein